MAGSKSATYWQNPAHTREHPFIDKWPQLIRVSKSIKYSVKFVFLMALAAAGNICLHRDGVSVCNKSLLV